MFPKAFSPWNPLKKFSQDLYSEKSTSGNTGRHWKWGSKCLEHNPYVPLYSASWKPSLNTLLSLCTGVLSAPRPPLPSSCQPWGRGWAGDPLGLPPFRKRGRLLCGFCNNERTIVSRMPRTHFQPNFFLKLREWEIIRCFCKKAFLKDSLNVIF